MKKTSIVGACALMVASWCMALGAAHAAYAAPPVREPKNAKVTICHRNNAVNNRYVQNSVSINAITGEDRNSHSRHQGPVAYNEAIAQELKSLGQDWGDIIPPFDDDGNPTDEPSYNWDEIGQAVWLSGCDTPRAASAGVVVHPATCEAPAQLLLEPATNAVYSGTAGGTYGPGTYSVTATATPGSLFYISTPPVVTQTYSGELADKLPAQGTDPEGECYFVPGQGGSGPTAPSEDQPVEQVAADATVATPEEVAHAPVITELPNTSGSSAPLVLTGAVALVSAVMGAASLVKMSILSRI